MTSFVAGATDAGTFSATGSAVGAPSAVSPRLEYQPALDGLRGLAVGVVWLYHLERLEGGFLGVDLFFVLSGFLITSLLVVEHRERGAIDLGRFWGRRARRLLPALLVLLTGTSLLVLAVTPPGLRHTFRGDALATLGYVANWEALRPDAWHWPPLLPHTWSLAIEEQFYVGWPLVAVLVLGGASGLTRRVGRSRGAGVASEIRVRHLGWWALGGAVGSLALMAWMYSPSAEGRAYYGTDSRLGPILLGAVLAVFASTRRPVSRPVSRPASGLPPGDELPRARVLHVRGSDAVGWGRELAGLVALAWMGWSVFTVGVISSWYYRGGLAVFSLAAVVVVWAVTADAAGPLARALSVPPLRWLGLISYGVYLWHWPVRAYVTFDRVDVDRWALDAIRILVTLAVAVLSYWLVELPIRRGALRGRRLWAATAGGVTITVLAVLAAAASG